MTAFVLIHGAADVGWYWHAVALSRPKELAGLLAGYAASSDPPVITGPG